MKKEFEYLQFIAWIALPTELRKPKKQKELAKKLKVEESTLSDWKLKKDFWNSVRKEINRWARNKTPDIILSLYKNIMANGKAPEIKLWFQYIENWNEKDIETELKQNEEHELNEEDKILLHKALKLGCLRKREKDFSNKK